MRAFLLQTVVPVTAVVCALVGVVRLGQHAGSALAAHPRYEVPFADLLCAPPAPMRRPAFLREVQYEADAPERVSRLDQGIPERLRGYFLRHPWVRRVERIEVRPSGAIDVRLSYRDPVLVVRGPDRLHAVSADGVFLPGAAATEGLPLLRGETVRCPNSGTRRGSETVVAAARTTALLRRQKERVDVAALEYDQGELILWTSAGWRIVWGQPPQQERQPEPSAELKCERLCASLRAVGDSPLPIEIDLRPAAGAARRLLVADGAR